ncbi:MAG: two component transcriptional regulator, LuxR family [Chloroflexota bacterium]|jgi:DNA-binding NarL/FixJ family response regulator|nr:two component transcriptional regulator, LuxR family [Chloroflexota bacterium]
MPPAEARSEDAPLRILVVDADDRVRESLTGLLAIGERVVIVGSSGHAGTALALATEHRPDVVIVDPRLPDLDGGLTFIAGLQECCPETRILAMSWSDALERRALDGGAHGFVRKTFRPTELIAAILAAGRPADA